MAARRQVQLMADTMITRSTTLTIFDENLASADWARFRGDLVRLAASAGADFVAALNTHAAITAMQEYDLSLIDDDSAAGVPNPTIPQVRQHSLLCVLRQGLQPSGESMRLIEACVHAGGVVDDGAGTIDDQAMIILDRRWGSAPIPKDGGLTARKLHSMSWPSAVTVDAYLGFYNMVVSSAATIGMNPADESVQAQQLRGTWWYVFARPPVSSPYYSVAVEARTVTRQEELTVGHRTAFRDAMVRAIRNQVAAGATSSKHTGRVVGARYGALLPGEVIPPELTAGESVGARAAAASQSDKKPLPSPFGGSGFRRCPKCPLQPDGSPTQHPSTYRCAKSCECDVCHSDRHLSHACFIKHGVPHGVKLQAEMLMEIRRLHDLYTAGEFDWAKTPTTLKWLLALRRTRQIPVAVQSAEVCGGDDEDGSENSYYDELREANVLGCTDSMVGPCVVTGLAASAIHGRPGAAANRGGLSDAYTAALLSTGGVPSAGVNVAVSQVRTSVLSWPPAAADAASLSSVPSTSVDRDAAPRPLSSFVDRVASSTDADDAPPLRQQARVRMSFCGGLSCFVLLIAVLPVLLQFVYDCAGAYLFPALSYMAQVVGSSGESVLQAWSSVLCALLIGGMHLFSQLCEWWRALVGGGNDLSSHAHAMSVPVQTNDLLVDSAGRSDLPSSLLCTSVVGGALLLIVAFSYLVNRRFIVRFRPWPWVVMVLSWFAPGQAMRAHGVPWTSAIPAAAGRSIQFTSSPGNLVVTCGCSVAQLTGAVPALAARPADAAGRKMWEDGLWIVDSGAELMIAGSFIYEVAEVVLREPDIYVKDVRGVLTRVDTVVRTVVTLPDGDHCIREVLVCDAFELALWSTEYMRHFGFAALLMEAGMVSSIRTPTGCLVPLLHRPYRVRAPCRAPTPKEFGKPGDVVGLERHVLQASVAGRALPRARRSPALVAPNSDDESKWPLVSVKDAWRIHSSWLHTGWRSLSKSLRVRFPPMPPCEVCRVTQSKRQSLGAQPQQATFAGQLTASDTWGPFMGALYFDGCRYIVVFVDVFSKTRFAVFCRDRTSATLIEAYKSYRAFMRCFGVEVCGEWLSDGGPEYVSEMAFDFCDDHAIKRLLSTRYEPRSNGVAEAVFRVYVPRVRSAILAANLPKQLYALAFQYALYLANRTFSRAVGDCPLARLPHPPVIDHDRVHTFGCRVWAHQPDVDRSDKLSPTARAGVFVGVSEVYKGYVVYYPETQEFESTVHCVFDDECLPLVDAAPPPPPHTPLPMPTPLPPVHVRERILAPRDIPEVPSPGAMPTGRRAADQHRSPAATHEAVRPRQQVEGTPQGPVPRRLFPAGPRMQRDPARALFPGVVNPLPREARPDTRRAGSRASAEDRFRPGASIAIVGAWSVSGVVLSQAPVVSESAKVVVVLFSGVDRPGSLPEALRTRGATVVSIDTSVGGRLHDLLDQTPESIGWHLLRAARRGEIHALHVALPCETFSVARADEDMVRSSAAPEFHMGLPGLSPRQSASVFASNTLIYVSLDIAAEVSGSGGEVTIENPAPRCDVTLPHVFWPAKSHHASLFHTLPLREYQVATASVLVVFPLCACGSPMQKYVAVLATPLAAHVLAPLDGLECRHASHDERAYGMAADGTMGALQSAEYPPMFSAVLACALLRLSAPGLDVSGASPLVVLGAQVTRVCGSRHLPTEASYASPDSHIFCAGPVTARHVGLLREDMVCAPGYASPVSPGWWNEADADDSDAEDDVFEVRSGGASVVYRACVKVPLAYKAAVRSRFSEGPGGVTEHVIPENYDAARVHPECAGIWEAMVREMNAHADCGTWELRPAIECYAMGKEPIGCMWVYDCKVDATTLAFLIWKARLVARGDQMVFMRDYLETYSGVVRHSTWRLFLAMCAQLGLVLTGSDVSTAYLHAPLRDYIVWMRQPRGFIEMVDGQPALCRLKMALYGLKQSAREWAITVITWLTSWGFTQCVSDRYLFVYKSDEGSLVLLIWVDDIFIGHDSAALRGRFMAAFSARFRVKDLGPLRQALGASVSQSVADGWVSFSLEKYIADLARRMHLLDNVAWADIPLPVAMVKGCVASAPSVAEVASTVEEYGALVGSLVFIATFARPDVAFAAHFLSRFLVRPGPVHLQLARRVLGYLSRTRALSITYRRGAGDPQFSFSPLDDGLPDRTGRPHLMVDTDHGVARSVTGWLFMYAGAATAWAVRGQTQPSLSSAESELYGLSTGLCAMLVCVQTLEEMRVVFRAPVPVLTDSRGARLLATDCAAAARTRHIHRRWFFVQHHLEEGHVVLKAVKGSLNPSNFLTKAVGGASFAADRAYALGSAKAGSM